MARSGKALGSILERCIYRSCTRWDYLVKVKLKNLAVLLKKQEWEVIDERKDIAICEFTYKAGSRKGARILKAIRTVKEYVEIDFFGASKIAPVYQYVC